MGKHNARGKRVHSLSMLDQSPFNQLALELSMNLPFYSPVFSSNYQSSLKPIESNRTQLKVFFWSLCNINDFF